MTTRINPGEETLPLPAGEIHVWYVSYADFVQPELPAAWRDPLDPEEVARMRRFLFERDRRSFAVSHALVRRVLSAYAEIPPEAWRFAANNYGRPEIAWPRPLEGLTFNLSHTRTAAICGVGLDCALGVDIESTVRDTSCVELADRYFSPSETADLHRQPAERQRERFFDFWTLKEAYIKARGMGLAIPLDKFSFDLSTPRAPRITIEPELGDSAAGWRFVQWSPDDQTRAAAAVRGSAGDYRFLLRRVVPDTGPSEPRPIP